jgi:hypothetical protein
LSCGSINFSDFYVSPAGDTYAPHFYGDGSGITGITISSADHASYAGNAPNDFFVDYGAGSNWGIDPAGSAYFSGTVDATSIVGESTVQAGDLTVYNNAFISGNLTMDSDIVSTGSNYSIGADGTIAAKTLTLGGAYVFPEHISVAASSSTAGAFNGVFSNDTLYLPQNSTHATFAATLPRNVDMKTGAFLRIACKSAITSLTFIVTGGGNAVATVGTLPTSATAGQVLIFQVYSPGDGAGDDVLLIRIQ